MNRYKFSEANILSAIKFLQKTEKNGPSWAIKFKDDLKIKENKLFYKNTLIVASEKVNDLLRDVIFKKNSDIPASRDACFHLCKQRYTGISRRQIMKFLQAQKSLGENLPSVAQAKRSAGEKMKGYTFETDLIFLKRADCIKADPRFEKIDLDKLPELMYIVSTCEKVTGLCRLTPCYKKLASVVTPIVEKHIKDMCTQLGTKPSSCTLRSDSGGEFNHDKLKKLVKNTKFVTMGPSIEGKNRIAQGKFFRILRTRKSKTVSDAISQSELLLNQTYNRIQKATPNELAKKSADDNVKQYNRKRNEHISSTKRSLEVGDHVRILVKEKKAGIGYKSYKNQTWTAQVYLVKRKTKKAKPPKYYVKGKWFLVESLLKAQPRDEKTMELIIKREEEDKLEEKQKEIDFKKKRDEEVKQDEKRKKEGVKKGTRRNTRGDVGREFLNYKLQRAKNQVEKDIEEQQKDKAKVEPNMERKREVIKKKLQTTKNRNLRDFSLDELKQFAKSRNLLTTGSKVKLKRRIKMYLKFKK